MSYTSVLSPRLQARLRRVIIHLNLLDLEGSIVHWHVRSPLGISVRPVVPDPRSGGCGHVGVNAVLEDTIGEEVDAILEPVDAVFVDGLVVKDQLSGYESKPLEDLYLRS